MLSNRISTSAAEQFVVREAEVPLVVWADGSVRLRETRLTVESVLGAYLRGQTPEEIAEAFPPTQAGEIRCIVAYFHRNRAELESYLERVTARSRIHIERIDRDFPSEGLKARLAERRVAAAEPAKRIDGTNSAR